MFSILYKFKFQTLIKKNIRILFEHSENLNKYIQNAHIIILNIIKMPKL